jgi:hypothetical protein
MTFFFGMESLMCHTTARQRERLSHTLYHLCEARNEAMQAIGGGSADTPAPVRTPRRTRTTSKKPASGSDGDADGESEPARYGISATAHEGFMIQTADGKTARLCVISEDDEILSDDVSREAFKVAVTAYRNFLQGVGCLRVHASAPGQPL